MLKDLKAFLLRGNVVDLAVGVIIATAFGAIVTSFVNDIITPLLLNPALKAAKVDRIAELSWNGVAYGSFLSAIINFVVVGTVLFFVVKGIEKAQSLGKTTFIKSIVNQIPFIKGEVRFGANVEIGYYDQTQSRLTPSNSVLDELWNDFKLTSEVEIRNRLGAFLFSGDDVKKSVGMLSGGEKARLLLAKLSMENNNFLILDEPTNHLDIDSKEVLENALIDFDGTLLFVSHDRYFINRVATHVLELSENGSTLYLGDYDYYVDKKAELATSKEVELEAINQEKESSSLNDYQVQKETQKELRKLMKQIEKLETEIEELETQAQDISEQMLTSNDAYELIQLQAELDKISQRQEEAMLEWEELSEQV